MFIAIGPFAWGKGSTIAEAKKNLSKMLRDSSVGRNYPYAVYDCADETTVTEMGDLSYPSDGRKPVKVEGRNGKR